MIDSPCVGGLECQIVDCGAGPQTTISGTTFAPNGTLPLFNVSVFIPQEQPAPFPDGVTCDTCGTPLSGNPLMGAQSNYKGEFQIKNPPSGHDIPLVIQLGKWRRILTVDVKPCQDNKLDSSLTRLPRTRSEGDMPRIAVTLGGCDQISCLLPKVGIDPSEFGVAGQNKAVTLYSTPGTTGPNGITAATPFWSSVTELSKYDIVVVSSECGEHLETKGATAFAAMTEYLDQGGRIFTTGFQYTWYRDSPDPALQTIGNITGGAPPAPVGTVIEIDTSFPKGLALANWLDYTELSTVYGNVTPPFVFSNFQSVDPMKGNVFGTALGLPGFMTFNTPVGVTVDKQCGKAVHLDAHINQGTDVIDASFPGGCTAPIQSAEAAFAYFFFDLAHCTIQNDNAPPR